MVKRARLGIHHLLIYAALQRGGNLHRPVEYSRANKRRKLQDMQ